MDRVGHRLQEGFFFLLPIIAVLIIWELLVDTGLIRAASLPSPLMIVQTLVRLLVPEPIILIHLYKSAYRLVIGFALGASLGVALGVLIGSVQIINKILSPIISFLIAIPTIAWVPVLLITFGIGDITIITAIFLGCFFPVVYNTAEGIRGINKQLIWASEIMGASRLATFVRIQLPGALVSILTGLKLGTGYSWRALVGAEMLAATDWGLGFMIYAARSFYDIKAMFLGLALIAVGGLIMDRVIMDPAERRTVERWGVVVKR